MPNILLTWELGGGMGHVTPSVGLVRRLIDGGADVHVAAKDLGPEGRPEHGFKKPCRPGSPSRLLFLENCH